MSLNRPEWWPASAAVACALLAGMVPQVRGTTASERGATQSGIAVPELPRTVPPSGNPYPGRACTTTVPPDRDIAAALRSARGGDVVCLTRGATYGPVRLPARAARDTGWIVLQSAGALPPEGTRAHPALAGTLARIVVAANGSPALTTTEGTSGYYLRGIEVTVAPSVSRTNALIELGSTEQRTLEAVPRKLVLAQMYIHGSSRGEMQRCVYLNSGATAIVDSWISECHGKGYDSQAIASINGPGPHLVQNNYLEGAGENVMWGGATPRIPGLVAADITFRRNHVRTPLAWKGVWTRKNLFELKNAVRTLVEDNVFEGSWTDAQIGTAVLLKSINDQGDCNWCRTTDVTFRRNLITQVGSGIVVSGAENYNGGSVDTAARRILFQDVVVERINEGEYAGGARGLQFTGGASDIVVERVLVVGAVGNMLVLDKDRPVRRTAFRNSVFAHGTYLATADGPGVGLPSIVAGLPGAQWSGMTLIVPMDARPNPAPNGTIVVASEGASLLAKRIRATVDAATKGVRTR